MLSSGDAVVDLGLVRYSFVSTIGLEQPDLRLPVVPNSLIWFACLAPKIPFEFDDFSIKAQKLSRFPADYDNTSALFALDGEIVNGDPPASIISVSQGSNAIERFFSFAALQDRLRHGSCHSGPAFFCKDKVLKRQIKRVLVATLYSERLPELLPGFN